MIKFNSKFKPLILLSILLLLQISLLFLYQLENKTKHTISNFSGGQWVDGISVEGPAFLVDFHPYAAGITVGSTLTVMGNETRSVAALVDRKDIKKWEIWVSGGYPQNINIDRVFFVKNDINKYIEFLLVFFLVFIISLLFTVPFMFLFDRHLVDLRAGNFQLRFGIAYFLGVAFFLLIWRVAALMLSSALYGSIFALFTLAIIIFAYRRNIKIENLNLLNNLLIFSILNFSITVYFMLYWVVPTGIAFDLNNTVAPLGPFPSGRYANVSHFIHNFNMFPILKENYGQSILAAIPSFFGFDVPQLSLLLWLSSAVSALVLLIFGVVDKIGGTRTTKAIVILLVLLGGPRLTILAVQLVDHHNIPILYSSYSDSIFSLGSLLIAYIFFVCAPGSFVRPVADRLLWLLPYILIGSLWAIVGIQALSAFAVFCTTLIISRRADFSPLKGRAALALISVFLGQVVATPFGGMLTPQWFFDPKLFITGALKAPSIEHLGVSIHTGYYWISDPANWIHIEGNQNPFFMRDTSWASISDLYGNILAFENNIIDLIRSLFFILLGLFFYNKYSINKIKNNNYANAIKLLYLLVISSLIFGVFVSTTLIISGRYWDFTRFMNPAYFFGMILFGLAASHKLSTYKTALGTRVIVICCLVLSVIGPALEINHQITAAYERLSFAGKINLMTSIPSQIERRNPRRAPYP